MDTAKIYHDSEGNECSIGQMIEREPHWAAEILQVGERAIERVALLEKAICIFAREELGGMEFGDDKECLDYFVRFASN